MTPTGVAIDRSATPNHLWVVDASNNRLLGWRDLAAAQRGGAADLVLGQPDMLSSGCNSSGLSRASLCFVYSTIADTPENPGVAVDAQGNVWVSDQGNYRVLGHRNHRRAHRPRLRPVQRRRLRLVRQQRGLEPHLDHRSRQGVALPGQRRRPGPRDRQALVPDDHTGLPIDFDATSLGAPSGVAVATTGELFVGDAFAHRVVVYDVP
jgi:hypothetical protein